MIRSLKNLKKYINNNNNNNNNNRLIDKKSVK